jgi:hypothetical protein
LAILKTGHISRFTFENLNQHGILHGVFMRHGGCSPEPWQSLNMATSVGDSADNVIENRKRIAQSLGIPDDSYFDVWQVHSKEIVVAEKPRKIGENHIQADGIITNKKNIAILMLFADCVPILFYDPRKNAIGCAHAGWQGTFKKVAAETVFSMQKEFDCAPEDIIAMIGPSIGVEHYEVRENVVDAARNALREPDKVIERIDGHDHVNLQLANQLILEEAGVKQVEQSNICTMCHPQDWFSHRGENGQTGRFAAVITLQSKA